MGYSPVLLASNPARYENFKLDYLRVLAIDTSNILEVQKAVIEENQATPSVAGIWSTSEYYIPVAAAAAFALGYAGPNAAAVAAARSKAFQRERFVHARMLTPKSYQIARPEQLHDAVASIGFPLVAKPVAGSGSIGVKRHEAEGEAIKYCRDLLKESEIVIESYVEGPEYSVEIFDGAAVAVVEKHLGSLPHFVEMGHDFPANVDETAQQDLTTAAENAVRCLDLGWGPVHVELRMTQAGPVVIEVNPRLAGGLIPILVERARGIDLIHATLRRVVGEQPSLQANGRGFASIRFVVPERSGRISAAEFAPRVQTKGIHIETEMYPFSNPYINHGDFRDRIAHAYAWGMNREKVAAAADETVRNCLITMTELTKE
jgi:biotin carboxylase